MSTQDEIAEQAMMEMASQQEPAAITPGAVKSNPDPNAKPLDLDFILDIPLQVKVEVGRTRMMIQELLQLTKGSVIELNKLLGENFEVMVNDKLVARGEVVVVNDRFGVRLTDIISPNDRVKSLA
ncbi:flagellar motor switch protein FliN [bacterium]|nr:flagellar motor switch protein FliN [bacterium]